MAQIIVYTKDNCPYCVKAKNLLNKKGVTYTEHNLEGRPEEIDRIKRETGWRTVPIILIDGEVIGGFDDMNELDKKGELDSLLK